MVVQNGMCYADNHAPVLKIVAAKTRSGYELPGWLFRRYRSPDSDSANAAQKRSANR